MAAAALGQASLFNELVGVCWGGEVVATLTSPQLKPDYHLRNTLNQSVLHVRRCQCAGPAQCRTDGCDAGQL